MTATLPNPGVDRDGVSSGNLAAVLLGAILLVVVAYRANTLSFTYDESQTYLKGISQGYGALFRFEFRSANNHLLNTLLATTSARIFGTSELALRLPNVLAFIPFLVFGWLTIREFVADRVSRIAALLLFASNPFTFDFFSLCRGYGLAVSCLSASIFCLVRGMTSGRTTIVAWGGWAAVAGTLANLSILNWFLAYWVVLLLCTRPPVARAVGMRVGFEHASTWTRIGLAQIGVLAVILSYPIVSLLKRKAFYYGGSTGLWTDTILSLATDTLYGAPYTERLAHVLGGVGVAVLVIGMVAACARLASSPHSESSRARGLLGCVLATGVCAGSIELQHWVLGTLYLISRTAMFCLVLVAVVAIGVLAHLPRRIGRYSMIVVAVVAAVHFAANVDLHRTRSWNHDANTKVAMRLIGIDVARHVRDAGTVQVAAGWMFAPTLNFYRTTLGLDEIAPIDRESLNRDADYYYYSSHEPPALPQGELVILAEFPDTDSVLALRRR